MTKQTARKTMTVRREDCRNDNEFDLLSGLIEKIYDETRIAKGRIIADAMRMGLFTLADHHDVDIQGLIAEWSDAK